MNAVESLAVIAQEVTVCERCELYHSRKNAVPGEGPSDAEIMFIGEGPGFHENEQGRPFVGAAGQFLDQLLAAAGLKRAQVWIGNVVKCRPPGNRDPLPAEIAECDAYLERQIKAIQPRIIITLGRVSMGKFMPGAKIGAVHGQMRRIGERHVIAMYHPAAALHNPALKEPLLTDFGRLPKLLEQARKAAGPRAASTANIIAESAKEEPKQLDLF